MYDHRRVLDLIDQCRPGHSLPQPFYVDPGIFEFDLRSIFYRSWILVGFEAELDLPGSYIATSIGESPILVLRNRQGEIRAFHNTCRHRGAQICKTGTGKTARLVCPYHQWTYSLDGTLTSARGAGPDLDFSAHNLIPVRVETVAGCIYVFLSEDAAPDFTPLRTALGRALKPYNLSQLKVAHVVELKEQANWKLVMENARECHHCAAGHPEFRTAFPPEIIHGGTPYPESENATPFMQKMRELGFDTGGRTEDWWQSGRIRFKDGFVSFSMDGKPLVRKPLVDANDGNLGTFRWSVEPNSFCHITSDSLFTFDANPTSPLTTTVTARWLVHKDAVEGVDYDTARLIHMWDRTNLQDRDLAENNQRGVNSVAYRPGPYSPLVESFIISFIDWYLSRARNALEGG
jgi:Rieske 2Fe-2S family protein